MKRKFLGKCNGTFTKSESEWERERERGELFWSDYLLSEGLIQNPRFTLSWPILLPHPAALSLSLSLSRCPLRALANLPMAAKTSTGSSATSSKHAAAKAASSTPWTNIVRGAANSEPISAAPPSPTAPKPAAAVTESAVANFTSSSPIGEEVGSGSSENVSASNNNAGKRPAWRSPSNGADTGASIEAQLWPALAESVKSPAKSSSDSGIGLADGLSSISISQVWTSLSSPQFIILNVACLICVAFETLTEQSHVHSVCVCYMLLSWL